MSLPGDRAGDPAGDPADDPADDLAGGGPVDPLDAGQVSPVLTGTVTAMGLQGLADLLSRLPGVLRRPATPARLFRAAVPEAVWLGPEDLLVLSAPPVHEHVVGEVVLQRTPLSPARLGPTLSGLVVSLVRAEGAVSDASAVLTAARDVLTRL